MGEGLETEVEQGARVELEQLVSRVALDARVGPAKHKPEWSWQSRASQGGTEDPHSRADRTEDSHGRAEDHHSSA
ncbi:hypothetical protein ROHU_014970 [Labeo rohita]|uniref:Uncharacterized protein n=1 Tax=Labeo rohita TaxID=84645 RepID=A0A498NQZ2_LABRO|nr:hypothetical protein ROHU_014970 [Labeo rohita]